MWYNLHAPSNIFIYYEQIDQPYILDIYSEKSQYIRWIEVECNVTYKRIK